MDDGDFREVDLTDLDLNQEPHGSVLEASHRIEEGRVLHPGPVDGVRPRQRWRQSRNSTETSYFHNEMTMVDEGNAPENHANAGVLERGSERGTGWKRDSSHLVAQALALDSEIKSGKEDGSFYDCNICLDLAKEPVLTSCGHLFCWPCFYQVSKVDSTVKQCPVCKEEVSDSCVIPIYGNGDSESVDGGKLGFSIPPRPKARRIESSAPQHVMQGLSYVPVSEAIRQILRIGALRQEQEASRGVGSPGINYQAGHIAEPAVGRGGRMHQVSRVLSDSAASLSSLSSALNSAERLVEDLETVFSSRRLRLHSRAMAFNPTNSSHGLSSSRRTVDRNAILNNMLSSQPTDISGSTLIGLNSRSNRDSSPTSHRRLGVSRVLERDGQDSRESRRRRLH